MNGTAAPSQIIINGQEYDPAEAQEAIELGNKYRDLETKWNTSLDKVVPEYTKATQRAAALEKELAEKQTKWSTYEEELAKREEAKKQEEVPQDARQALDAARKLGLLDVDTFKTRMKEDGYLTRKEFEELSKAEKQKDQEISKVLKEADRLEKEIDGSDGRIPFMKDAVLAYASTYQINDLSEAYDRMFERGNAGWKAQQLEAAKPKGLKTIKGGGSKEPPARTKTTDDNVNDRLKEALWGTSE